MKDKVLDIQVCRRKKTKDGLGEECFCVEDFKKEKK